MAAGIAAGQGTVTVPPAGYAGSELCGTCHEDIANAFGQNPHHAAEEDKRRGWQGRSCESCHGPGQKHTESISAEDIRNPGKLAAAAADKLCLTCHLGQSTPCGPFAEQSRQRSGVLRDMPPTESAMLSGVTVDLVKVQNGVAGGLLAAIFTIKDTAGNAVPPSKLSTLTLTMAGSNSDYGYTSFGSDVTAPGYVSESAIGASCGNDGSCLYTFKHAIPAKATGSYTIGIEARRAETLLQGTTKEMNVTYGATNKVIHFSVDGSRLQARRTVVATSNCNQCHVSLSVHGGLRNQTEYCVLCHNPSNTDVAGRPTAVIAGDRALPLQGINFNLLVHRIHSGEKLLTDNRPYVVVGFGVSHNDFSEVRYPAMGPTGSPGERRNCSMCHVNGSEQNLPIGMNTVQDPQGPLHPIQAASSARTGCHVTISNASHALANTTTLSESCTTCHNSQSAFSVGQVHAMY